MSSYSIEPNAVVDWLDLNLKLPRFQRRGVWNEEQNFELCISIFQDYPIGVVVINKNITKDGTTNWLLDGRQRRKALDLMHSNPVEVYKWAKKYIGFNQTEDVNELRKKYWKKVEKFLTSDEANQSDNALTEKNDSEELVDINFYGGEEKEKIENSFNAVRQRKGLNTLLELILMVHQLKKKKNTDIYISRWESIFDFREFFRRLPYAPTKNKGEIDPFLLRNFINELRKIEEKENHPLNEEEFCEYYLDSYAIADKKEKSFKTQVNTNWKEIRQSIDVITETEKVFKDARIGVIWLTNASQLDQQNIFSRINKGGTQLKPEELLSAKPFWNTQIVITDNSLTKQIKELYEKMEVEIPSDVVRWDLPATLISRIDSEHYIFRNYKALNNEELSMEEISMGFKLISSVFLGGMSKIKVNDLEYTDKEFATKEDIPTIDWNNDIDDLVNDINKICKILETSDFFNTLNSWKKSISELMGSAIALEFITILLKDWKERGCPEVDSGELKAFKRDALYLFDRLVFEYGTKAWRGSGDSKMANDIKSWKERIVPVEESIWKSYIEAVCTGEYNGQNTTVPTLTPVLYYFYSLRGMTPLNEAKVSFDVDHITAKDLFVDNAMVDIKLRDSLINLALLPKKENERKNDDLLCDIKSQWLKKNISIYSDIPETDFPKYTSVLNVRDAGTIRKPLFIKTFTETRRSQLA